MNPEAYGSKNIKAARNNLLNRFVELFSAKENVLDTATEEISQEQELIEAVKYARKEWAAAYTNFENAKDELMVDYYTYNIKACEAKYEYYLKLAKEKGVRV